MLKTYCSACATLGMWFIWQVRNIILELVVAQGSFCAWLKKMVSRLFVLSRTVSH
jgi:hypothetical protein